MKTCQFKRFEWLLSTGVHLPDKWTVYPWVQCGLLF